MDEFIFRKKIWSSTNHSIQNLYSAYSAIRNGEISPFTTIAGKECAKQNKAKEKDTGGSHSDVVYEETKQENR